ncbi:ABC transporter permease subunit [Alicyclobacillus tolerans]|uniref:ABC transporter permease n=1 Tax=Alicyclobacillus tolerans TaxID=90970 RepID=UPI001F00A284|nr:ABC transporter permease subunit [Alicyclobacillus tolerans]MCF8566139.1 ABC transporter permease subunit [Alicyclobacillus tolerans]
MRRNWLNVPSIPKISWVDGVMAVFVFSLLYVVVQLSAGMGVPFSPQDEPHIRLAWWMLPYYAGRSLLRMFIAFAFSLLFTFIYGRLASTYKMAERILIPLLDILQSVPVLGFLSITVTGFMGLFPHSLLGVELASIFAIFTGQVWNMTFSFYYSVSALPRELKEASNVLRLDSYTRFTRLELPYSMIGLVFNSMMSFGGGWFFLAASESITVLNRNIQLPGIGSYMATAMKRGDIPALVYAIVAMVVMIVLVDQLFWRPIVAWSEKFKMDMSGNSEDAPKSWFLTFLRRSKLTEWIAKQVFGSLFRAVDTSMLAMAKRPKTKSKPTRNFAVLRKAALFLVAAAIGIAAVYYGILGIREVVGLGWHMVLHIVLLGLYTLLRVMASTLLALLWTIPVGVAIGMNPKASRIAQPLVQILASFPANLLFPLVALLYLRWHINFQIGAVPLMMLGTQWYILFNVIAGAMAIPNDLKEATKVLRLRGWQRWKSLILPSIFPYLVTGSVTASGGAWNASIIAELVSWKGTTLAASGIGAFITQATQKGQWPEIIFSITVMAVMVTVINRLLWRRMYRLAESRFNIGG